MSLIVYWFVNVIGYDVLHCIDLLYWLQSRDY